MCAACTIDRRNKSRSQHTVPMSWPSPKSGTHGAFWYWAFKTCSFHRCFPFSVVHAFLYFLGSTCHAAHNAVPSTYYNREKVIRQNGHLGNTESWPTNRVVKLATEQTLCPVALCIPLSVNFNWWGMCIQPGVPNGYLYRMPWDLSCCRNTAWTHQLSLNQRRT